MNNCFRPYFFPVQLQALLSSVSFPFFRTFLGTECPLSELYQIMLEFIFHTNIKCEIYFIWILYSFKDREAPFISIHSERWQNFFLVCKKYLSNIHSIIAEIYFQSKALNPILGNYLSYFISCSYNKNRFWNNFT